MATPARRRSRRERRHRRRRDENARRHARFDDAAKMSSSRPTKRPRLRSVIGEVRGELRRADHGSELQEDATPPGSTGAVPTPSLTPIASHANCDVTPVIVAGAAGDTTPSFPPPTAFGIFLAPTPPLPAPPLPSASQHQDTTTAPVFAAMPPPPACPKKRKTMIPATQRPPAKPIFAAAPIPLPAPQGPQGDRAELLKHRYAGLIAKSQKEIADRYREELKKGRPPSPEPEVAVVIDQEALRRNAERERSRQLLREVEEMAAIAGLFVQYARPEQLRALGIDEAMERVVSPERERGEDGAPVLSPQDPPRCPVEKLGCFLRVS